MLFYTPSSLEIHRSHAHCNVSLSSSCFLRAVALSYILHLCGLGIVCTVRYLENTSRLRENKGRGLVVYWGPFLCILFESLSERRRGRKIIGRGASERYTAAIARTQSETPVMRNPILIVCRSSTKRPSSRRHALNSLKIARGKPHLSAAEQGKPPNEKMENSLCPSPPLSHSVVALFPPYGDEKILHSNLSAFYLFSAPYLVLPPLSPA